MTQITLSQYFCILMMNNDEAVNHIFEMVKDKINQAKKKKKRKRVYTVKQKEQMLRSLAKGQKHCGSDVKRKRRLIYRLKSSL